MTSFEFVLSIFFRWKFIKSYFFLNIENMKIKKIMIQLPIFSCLNSTVLTFKKKPINKIYIYR